MILQFVFYQIVLLLILLTSTLPVFGKTVCKAPEAVCAATSRVFRISSFDPLASAVLVGPSLFVTNRHVVADEKKLKIFIPSHGLVEAEIIPTSYKGDLILFRVEGLKTLTTLTLAKANRNDRYYTIGADIRSQTIRVYKPGHLLLPLAANKPFSRLHNNAYSQPGNSGGALVNENGHLVAIISSGGDGRNEAIPSSEIEVLKSLSGTGNEAESQAMGVAYRNCIEALDILLPSKKRPPPKAIITLNDQCRKTNNRQLWDLSGQTFSRIGRYRDAIEMFSRALEQDPNSINSMISMAIALHLSGYYVDEVIYLRRLIKILPSNANVLRLGVQAGAWGNDKELMEKSLGLMKIHHPKLAPLAQSFIKKNPTPPKRP
ncbi:MAG: trypsin-like peptidase domain-containing protein [Pseudomonadota bacterium]|nr:trypsin-like peptidase domain-containing protein [Pseudomonadota bacterium]